MASEEVMVIEGFFDEATKEHKMKGLGALKDDLMDTKGWMRAIKAGVGGGASKLGFSALFTYIPWVNTLSAMTKSIVKGVVGALAGVALERHLGEAFSYGLIGEAFGGALGGIGLMGINSVLPAGTTQLADVNPSSFQYTSLTPGERMFLNGMSAGGRGLREVIVSDQNLLNEVAVENVAPGSQLYGLENLGNEADDAAARDAVMFS